MSTKFKYILWVAGALALLIIGFALGVYGSQSGIAVGGVSYEAQHFAGDLYQGMNNTLIFRDGTFQGAPIATATLLTTSGGITNSGALTQSGAATLSGSLSATGASTLKCLKIYDGATTTASYYAYASGTDMYVTSTKPTLCP